MIADLITPNRTDEQVRQIVADWLAIGMALEWKADESIPPLVDVMMKRLDAFTVDPKSAVDLAMRVGWRVWGLMAEPDPEDAARTLLQHVLRMSDEYCAQLERLS